MPLLALLLLTACTGSKTGDTSSGGGSGGDGDGGGGGGGRCETSQDCVDGEVCDRGVSSCVDCRTNADCDAGDRCASGACVEGEVCEDNTDCTGTTPACGEGGVCVDCASAADCIDEACIEGSCLPWSACVDDVDCTSDGLVCAEAEGEGWPESYAGYACQECGDSGDCPTREACDGGLCYDVCTPAGAICGEVDGVSCGECPDGGTCAPGGGLCYVVMGNPGVSSSQLAVTEDAAFLVDSEERTTVRLDFESGDAEEVDGLGLYGDEIASDGINGWIADADGGVLKVTPGRTSAREVATVVDSCWHLAVEGDWIYCALRNYDNETSTNGLFRIPVDGGDAEDIDTGNTPDGFYIQDDFLYYYNFNDAAIYRVPTDSTDTDRLMRGLQPYGLVVGADTLFILTSSGLYTAAADGSSDETLLDADAAVVLEFWEGRVWYTTNHCALMTWDPETDETSIVIPEGETCALAGDIGRDDALYLLLSIDGDRQVVRIDP